ncbi:MAG: homoserine dehydrogenase [Coriobacteriia bacterium]|nr:homoserine dehydrogenase [Coriobacteriia bacterium]MBN2847380.1 homoserine dehydrogenase [Coriobacteriia bacterium]
MRTINVGLIGLGTVGSGVVEILARHGEQFRTRAGVDVALVKCADRSTERADALGIEPARFTTEIAEVIDDPAIDIVVELIGGTGVAREVVLGALRAGKTVVTANKALMATHGREVMDEAAAHGADILFEASVGGGIPIINPLKHSLVSNEIQAVYGIVNGTTNFMLTRMAEDGLDYETALAEAQERGFAEADPTADVDGLDAAAKIAILASIAFNSRVTFADVPAEGIRDITPGDIAYARETGYEIKLVAIGKRTPQGIDVRVQPTMIRAGHPLAKVNGVYNAIYVVGDAVGETMFFGEGAGSLPAASAVVGDIIEAARHIERDCRGLVGCTCSESLPLTDIADLETSYYVRLDAADEPGVLAAIAGIFADNGVSLASVIQRQASEAGAEIVWITHRAAERDMRAALERIGGLETVRGIGALLRVEEL